MRMVYGGYETDGPRVIKTEVATPVVSSQRRATPAYVPPFSFVGELEIGNSGFWYPTSRMELITASLSASDPGTGTAIITINVEEPGTSTPVVIATLTLAPTETKTIKEIDNATVTPYDKVYVTSWAESGHAGVVIQMVGNIAT